MNEKPKSKWYVQVLRWGLLGIVIIVTLVAIVVTEEDWRGKHAWETYKRDAAAKGDPVDRMETWTNNIPGDQNFTQAPIFEGIRALKWDEKKQDWDTTEADRFKMRRTRSDGIEPKLATHSGDFSLAKLADLPGWQNYYRMPTTNSAASGFPTAPRPQSPAADVLLALSKYDPVIDELRTASLRPYSRFADYSANDPKTMSRLLIYLAEFKSAYSVIQLRALAELGADQPDKALEDVKLLLRLNDTLRQEPLLIAHLVSLATMAIAMQPIYEGLAQHKWSDAQLAELERAIAEKDFLADYQKAMRGERTFAIGALENMRLTREYKTIDDTSGVNKVQTTSFRLMPSAFFYQNELAFAQLHEQFCLPLVDLQKRIASPAIAYRAEAGVQKEMKHFHPYKMYALMTFPAIGKAVIKFTVTQSYADMAQVACGLERYEIARGNYPETLDALVPQFVGQLPHDIISGQPLHYHRTEGGKFVLYSVGWNEKDDGGTIAQTKNGSNDREKGDWVWHYPGQ